MSLTAADIMTRTVLTAAPDDTVAKVARLLSDHKISAAPVCDAAGHLLGMVSEGDLMRPFIKENDLKREWWLEMLAEGSQLAPAFIDYVKADHRRAVDLMTSPVITAREDMSVPDVAELLSGHLIKRVPVLRDGRITGIVSRSDIVRALAYTPEEEGV
jgi:CBS domain-containing protein